MNEKAVERGKSMAACTFFGHADFCGDIYRESLKEKIEQLITQENVSRFFVGDTGAFDRCSMGVLRELRQQYACIDCMVVRAYLRPAPFSYDDVEQIYPEGLEKVPARFAIDWRNRWMTRQSEYVIAYVRHSVGGAARFMRLAQRQGKIVYNLADISG